MPIRKLENVLMALTNETIKQRLVTKFGEQLTAFEEPYGMLPLCAAGGRSTQRSAVWDASARQ